MNENLERRLTDALAARASEVEPRDEHDALERISRRVNMRSQRRLLILGVAAAVLAAVVAVALVRRDDKPKQQVTVASDTSASSSSSTTSPVIPAEPAPIWPFAGSGKSFSTAADAAKSFAVEYLGMTLARVGSTNGTDVEIFPNDRASIRTVVQTEHRSWGWVVVGAKGEELEVDTPKPHDRLTATLTLSGRSRAFEAQIGVDVRPFGSLTPAAHSYVMGGSTELAPFSGKIDVPATDQPLVLVLFEADASGQGAVTMATVIPLDAGK